jgi:hypothetical protein
MFPPRGSRSGKPLLVQQHFVKGVTERDQVDVRLVEILVALLQF